MGVWLTFSIGKTKERQEEHYVSNEEIEKELEKYLINNLDKLKVSLILGRD